MRGDNSRGERNLSARIGAHTFERKVTLDECEEHDTQCPHVGLVTAVLLLCYDLRRHIGWGAAEHPHFLLQREACRKPEIDHFGGLIRGGRGESGCPKFKSTLT